MVKGCLSIRALAVDDLQCDKSAAKRLNSGYLIENDWASFGTRIAEFVNSLLVSGWTAAGDFTISQSLSNVLLAFYLLLVQTMCAQNRHGAKWQRYWLPPVTIRNLCDLAGHFVLSSRFWPPNVPWRPKARQEACIEWFFGLAKSCTRGSPSTKDGLYGIQMAHAQQLRQVFLDVFSYLKFKFHVSLPKSIVMDGRDLPHEQPATPGGISFHNSSRRGLFWAFVMI